MRGQINEIALDRGAIDLDVEQPLDQQPLPDDVRRQIAHVSTPSPGQGDDGMSGRSSVTAIAAQRPSATRCFDLLCMTDS